MRKFAIAVRSFLTAEDGPTAVEYAVMLAPDHRRLLRGHHFRRNADPKHVSEGRQRPSPDVYSRSSARRAKQVIQRSRAALVRRLRKSVGMFRRQVWARLWCGRPGCPKIACRIPHSASLILRTHHVPPPCSSVLITLRVMSPLACFSTGGGPRLFAITAYPSISSAENGETGSTVTNGCLWFQKKCKGYLLSGISIPYNSICRCVIAVPPATTFISFRRSSCQRGTM